METNKFSEIAIQILHLEDNSTDAELVQLVLRKTYRNAMFVCKEDRDGFINALEENTYDIILADYSLPSFNGMSALKIATDMSPNTPFIFLSGNLGEELAIDSLINGATDYVLKHRINRLVPAINRALQESEEKKKRLEAELLLARQTEELRLSNKELIRSNEELQQFAYLASHDLQEPIRMVGNFAELLAKRYEDQLDDKAKQYVYYIVDGASRMSSLINDLLRYSRVGKSELVFKTVEGSVLFESALRNLSALIEECNPKITHDALPKLCAVPSLLTQVLQNLIGNALKFCVEETPNIHVGVEEKDGEWVFSVQDNGIGIDNSFKERIFIIFQRLHTRKEYQGNGIGLSICKKIIHLHEGEIWFESELGEGTTFHFTIPKKRGQTIEKTISPKSEFANSRY